MRRINEKEFFQMAAQTIRIRCMRSGKNAPTIVSIFAAIALPGHRVRKTSSMAWWLVGLEDESLKTRKHEKRYG